MIDLFIKILLSIFNIIPREWAVKSWSIFMTSLEPTLSKIPEKTLLREKRFLRKATAEKRAENQARKSRAASA